MSKENYIKDHINQFNKCITQLLSLEIKIRSEILLRRNHQTNRYMRYPFGNFLKFYLMPIQLNSMFMEKLSISYYKINSL